MSSERRLRRLVATLDVLTSPALRRALRLADAEPDPLGRSAGLSPAVGCRGLKSSGTSGQALTPYIGNIRRRAERVLVSGTEEGT